MNMKDAHKLRPGAIVRESWFPLSDKQGIVLAKEYVNEPHRAKKLCQKKTERYDVTVHWLGDARTIPQKKWGEDSTDRVQVRENWELMVISHAPS